MVPKGSESSTAARSRLSFPCTRVILGDLETFYEEQFYASAAFLLQAQGFYSHHPLSLFGGWQQKRHKMLKVESDRTDHKIETAKGRIVFET